MIDPTAVLWAVTAVYASGAVGLAVVSRRVAPGVRRFCLPLVGFVALGAVDSAVQAAGLGTVAVGAGEVRVSTLALDVLGYLLLYGGVTLLAGAPRRLVATVTGVAVAQRLAFSAGNAAAPGTTLATVAGVGIFLGFPVVVALLLRPVWRRAQSVPDHQRLLHWKVRNLLVFSFGMLVVYAVVFLGGVVTDPVLTQLLVQYPNLYFRVGVPAVIVVRLAGLEPDATFRLRPDSA